MKATDLMIGDWVLSKSISVPCKVVGIDPMEGLGREGYTFKLKGPNNILLFVHAVSIDTIPLAPEILEKNGFKKGDFMEIENQHTWTLVLDTIHYVSLWTRNLYDNADEGWVLKAETSQVNGGLSLNAVHELQHALRLCGIEKEITLN